MTAFTLAQLAKLETEPLRKGVIMNLLRDARVMEVLPFENVNSLRSIAVRWATLPTVSFRGINVGYTPDEGDYEQVYESVYGFGGEIEFDRVFDKIANTIIDPKTDQTKQKLKALALTYNDYFINGDHATDADGFEGLKKRIDAMPSRQKVHFTTNSTDSVLDPTASAANARLFLDKLEELHYKCNRGQVNAFLMNEGLYYGLGRVLRYLGASGAGLLATTRDSFDREINTYKGAPMIDIGLKRDQTTEIITNTETAGDAGSDATSIYAVSFGTDEALTGIQLSPMDVYDPLAGGERESKPTKLMRIDWWIGLANFGSYGIARGWNIEAPSAWT